MSFVPGCDLGIISPTPALDRTIGRVTREFNYSFQVWNTLEEFMESPTPCKLFISGSATKDAKDAAEKAQGIQFSYPGASLACVIAKPLKPEESEFLQKSGAKVVMLEQELETTCKLEFACSQLIGSAFFAIKAIDLVPGSTVTFPVFHMMPQRNKYVQAVAADTVLDEEKYKKMLEVGQFFIRRDSTDAFNAYTKATMDQSAAGILRRCRSQFLEMSAAFTKLIFQITDESGYATFEMGSQLLESITKLSGEFLVLVGTTDDGWSIVNQSCMGEYASVERAPAIAAYAAMFGLQMDVPKLEQTMVAGLVADLGQVFMSDQIIRKVREGGIASLNEVERDRYEKYPLRSISQMLDRKMQVDEQLKKTVLMKNRLNNGEGFPQQGKPKLTVEAQLLQLGALYDQATAIVMGSKRPDMLEERKKAMAEHLTDVARFTPEFLDLMKKVKF